MSYRIIRGNLIESRTDAVVNPANLKPIITPGIEMDLYKAAGYEELLRKRMNIGERKPAEVFATPAFGLYARRIIHVIVPPLKGDSDQEYDTVRKVYRNTFSIAEENHFNSISMPIIGLGIYGFSAQKAVDIAIDEAEAFLANNAMSIFFVLSEETHMDVPEALSKDLEDWLKHPAIPSVRRYRSLREAVEKDSETFSDRFFRLVDEKGWKDSEVYNRANVDRRIISRLRSDSNAAVSKNTAISLAIALKLTAEETKELLALSGWALSDSSTFDRIIMFFLEKRRYNLAEINETLYAYCDRCLM